MNTDQQDYRRLVQYDKSDYGKKLKLLLEWHEIKHIIGDDRFCLQRWLDRSWVTNTFPDHQQLNIDTLVKQLTAYLIKKAMVDWKNIIIEYCIMDFLINAEFGISDVRGFDPTTIFVECKDNTEITECIKKNIKFSTDGYAYSTTTLIKGSRDFNLSHDIIRLWTEQRFKMVET
jgi:hypothetical protein